MVATACKRMGLRAGRSVSTVTLVSFLTLGNGILPALLIIMGECSGSGSSGCGI